jgi:uncharacterized protein with FMN-binding domain
MKKMTPFGLFAVVLTVFLFLAGCPSPTSSGGEERTPVADGSFETQAPGKSEMLLMTVTSTIAHNTWIDINIGPHEEAGHILDSVKALLIPRIIGAQSIGVDIVAGATFSSVGVLEAVGLAIEKAGGNVAEWRLPLPVNNSVVKLFDYDVIVVGLGGSGTAAYLKASESVTKNGQPYYPAVYGIEVAGKIGGNSATVGGPMATNSQFIKNFYGIGDYVDEDALKQQWFADMKADVPADVISARGWDKQNFVAPYGEDSFFGPGAKGQTFDLPQITTKIAEYNGGPKWQIVDKFIDESGETVDWLANSYNFHFNLPSGLSFPQYQIVINYGSDNYTPPGGYAYDGTPGAFKTVMFTRAIETAKLRNPKSNYKLELRATDLIMADGKVAGVKARYRDGTTYEIYGKTVILATGGFIGNPSMSQDVYGTAWKAEAVETQRGDGIKMAEAVGAARYNIKTPPAVHISNVKNIIRNKFLYDDRDKDAAAKSTVTSMLLKGDSMVVGLMDASGTYPTVPDYQGKRFCKEKATEIFAMTGLDFMSWAVGGYYAAIFSNDEIARIKAEGLRDTQDTMFWMVQGGLPAAGVPIPDIDDIINAAVAKGNAVKGATLEDLAKNLNINAETLTASITMYNSFVDANIAANGQPPYSPNPYVPPTLAVTDSFDEDFEKPNQWLVTKVTLDCPSGYTAILGAGYPYGTTAGLDVNEKIQVLNTAREVIPGLYAVGQDSSGVLYNDTEAYVGYGAADQGWAVTAGRWAGENAAKEAAGIQ